MSTINFSTRRESSALDRQDELVVLFLEDFPEADTKEFPKPSEVGQDSLNSPLSRQVTLQPATLTTVEHLYFHPCFKDEETFFKVHAYVVKESAMYPCIGSIIKNIKILHGVQYQGLSDAVKRCISVRAFKEKKDEIDPVVGAKKELDAIYLATLDY